MPKAEGGCGPDSPAWLYLAERGSPPPVTPAPLPSFLRPSRHSCAGRNPGDRPTPAAAQGSRRPRRHSPTRRRTFEAKHSHRSPGFPPAQRLPPLPPPTIPAPLPPFPRHSHHPCPPPRHSCAPPVTPAQAGIQATAQPPPRHSARDGLAGIRPRAVEHSRPNTPIVRLASCLRSACPPCAPPVIPAPLPPFLRPSRDPCAPPVIPAQAGIHAI